eukprot:TRINITY_DN26666_c0_g1_i3.p2 TRINITY_DN26666_c0_g1~~TRINITY_DN26666_c0_g1_i3.p2  ORF type:complete len:137 (+),score=33.31 TRINITY_DN26666_c0_g1_i3:171-581(+)
MCGCVAATPTKERRADDPEKPGQSAAQPGGPEEEAEEEPEDTGPRLTLAGLIDCLGVLFGLREEQGALVRRWWNALGCNDELHEPFELLVEADGSGFMLSLLREELEVVLGAVPALLDVIRTLTWLAIFTCALRSS